MTERLVRLLELALVVVLLAGGGSCALHPRGEKEERGIAARASRGLALENGSGHAGGSGGAEQAGAFAQPKPLAPDASLEEMLEYAYASNQDLHKMYWEWTAALEAIPQEASLEADLAVSLESMFEEGGTSLEQTTLGVGNAPMSMIPWPGKLSAGGKRALEMARAAGSRFLGARLELRTEVLTTYYDYALTAEMLRLKGAELPLIEAVARSREAAVRAGTASTIEVLEAQTERDLAASELATLRARATGQAAMLNALLGREPLMPLDLPSAIPQPRALPYGDAEILELVARKNPELQALAHEVEAGTLTVSLARQQYIPDLGLSVSGDLGGMTKSVMAMLSGPVLRLEAIRASIRQARAELEASRAVRRQAGSDLKARAILMLYDLRDAERRADLLGRTVIPRLEQTIDAERAGYQAGRSPLTNLLKAQRMLLDGRGMLAELRIEREKLLAEIEEIAGTEAQATAEVESEAGTK